MTYREIPADAVEIQTGLWAQEHPITYGGITRMTYYLYAAEGYCFYSLGVPENFDEEGNLKPAEERLYALFQMNANSTIEAINEEIVSVPYVEGYEILTVGGVNPPVTE